MSTAGAKGTRGSGESLWKGEFFHSRLQNDPVPHALIGLGPVAGSFSLAAPSAVHLPQLTVSPVRRGWLLP